MREENLKTNDKVNPVADSSAPTPETLDRSSGSTHCSPPSSTPGKQVKYYCKSSSLHDKESFKHFLNLDPSLIKPGAILVRMDGEFDDIGMYIKQRLVWAGITPGTIQICDGENAGEKTIVLCERIA